ncbi:MAG: hypothetical protein GY953_50280, partial [bacterium]|nr:hypothetical protein [bacterium]
MKTTVEIPDALFREAKAAAARRGTPLKELFTEALRSHLRRSTDPAPAWMGAFGELADLHEETKR